MQNLSQLSETIGSLNALIILQSISLALFSFLIWYLKKEISRLDRLEKWQHATEVKISVHSEILKNFKEVLTKQESGFADLVRELKERDTATIKHLQETISRLTERK